MENLIRNNQVFLYRGAFFRQDSEMKLLGAEIIFRGSLSSNSIACTFDDGPHSINSPKILNILDTYNAKATYFVTGKNCLGNKSVLREMVEKGHCIGNHMFNHPKVLFVGYTTLFNEIKRTKDIIEDVTGIENRYFRPPYGLVNFSLLKICRDLGLKIILWNVMSFDFRMDMPEKIVKRVMKKNRPGNIICFHEGHFENKAVEYTNTVTALDTILNENVSKGIKMVTIRELLNDF